MSRSQPPKVYGPEDLSILVENLPEGMQGPLTTLNYSIINHDAYNNPNYRWSKQDFELGTPLGKGRKFK